MTEKCCDSGKVNTGDGKGRVEVIKGINTYVTGSGSHLLVISTDVFGQEFPNIRIVADRFASAGFTVIIPDQFNGDAWTLDRMNNQGFQGLFNEWFPKHPATTKELETVIQEINQQGKYTSIQATGYCYGAPQVVELLSKNIAKAGVVAHPTRLTIDLAQTFNAPILFNCAERDGSFTPELRKQWEEALKSRGVPATFIDYSNVDHGFAVRGDGKEHTEAEKERCIQETIKFLQAHA